VLYEDFLKHIALSLSLPAAHYSQFFPTLLRCCVLSPSILKLVIILFIFHSQKVHAVAFKILLAVNCRKTQQHWDRYCIWNAAACSVCLLHRRQTNVQAESCKRRILCQLFLAGSSAWSCCISVSVTTVCTLLVLLFIVSGLCSSVSSFFFVVERNRWTISPAVIVSFMARGFLN